MPQGGWRVGEVEESVCMCRVVPGALNASLVIWGFHIGLRFLVKCYTALIKRWN